MTTKTKTQMNTEKMEAAFATAKNDTNLNSIETVLTIADNNGWLWNAVRGSAFYGLASAFLTLDDLSGRQNPSPRQIELIHSLESQVDESINLALWADVEHIQRDVPATYRASAEDSARYAASSRENREIADINEGYKLMATMLDDKKQLNEMRKNADLEIEAVKLLGADNYERVLKFMNTRLNNSKLPAAFEVSERTAFFVIRRLYNWLDKRASSTEVMKNLRNVASSARASMVAEMHIAMAILPQVKAIHDNLEHSIENAGRAPFNGQH